MDSSLPAAPPRCAVVGDGSMGTTLAHVMAAGGHACVLWCASPAAADAVNGDHRHPARPAHALDLRLRATASLGEALAGAGLVVVAVHSTAFAAAAREIGALAEQDTALFSATKGIEHPSLRLMSRVLADAAPGCPVGTLGGTNITGEIMAGQLSSLVVASPSAEARARAARALAAPHLAVVAGADLFSVELVSVLKNTVSIAAAMGLGAGMGYNGLGLVVARTLAEIRALGTALGADPAAFDGPAGIGDVFLTASSPQSLNRRLGMELGQGRRLDEIVAALPEVPEGIGAVRAVAPLAAGAGLSLPVCAAVAEILDGVRPPRALERALIETYRKGMG
ncbi:NAD(P)H-dependent glycerol-3-phosphate dehydrogenase [Longimicrobium sp.]|uniref:NAD(P)H-dependent glycerol-3-phosphate dehydrogenase n=1 Tax=Longimicrobium sp. TaxID=2029185 RepID=UPI002E37C2C1|nr:NAD(P)H-dependent glycerol-3-phosphate dehydrogenase [Longimicrobium sp.]HEX6037637.1 NAD(P)H-dependent glycerol-3-phosphate dehydrogenase [Longimicrobium sp.]